MEINYHSLCTCHGTFSLYWSRKGHVFILEPVTGLNSKAGHRGQYCSSHMPKDLGRENSPRNIRVRLVGNKRNGCQDGNQFTRKNLL